MDSVPIRGRGAAVGGQNKQILSVEGQTWEFLVTVLEFEPNKRVKLEVLTACCSGELWPTDFPLRAGVSAMGFGGINGHLALENPAARRRATLTTPEQQLLRSQQDVELFLFAATTPHELQSRLHRVREPTLAAPKWCGPRRRIGQGCKGGPYRSAMVAATQDELAEKLQAAIDSQPSRCRESPRRLAVQWARLSRDGQRYLDVPLSESAYSL